MKLRKIDKKALSEVIAYVMLIVIGMSLAILVYGWMKSQLPGEEKKCPDGVSLVVSDYNCTGNRIKLTVKNKGRFNLDGYIVRGVNESDYREELTTASRFFYNTTKSLGPTEEYTSDYLSYTVSNISKIEVIPLRSTEKGQTLCSEDRVIQKVNC